MSERSEYVPIPPAVAEHAACLGMIHNPNNPFDLPNKPRDRATHPAATRSRRIRNLMIAKAHLICQSCPVLAECRQWALTLPDPGYHMYLADMTPEQRREQRKTAPERNVA